MAHPTEADVGKRVRYAYADQGMISHWGDKGVLEAVEPYSPYPYDWQPPCVHYVVRWDSAPETTCHHFASYLEVDDGEH